MRWRAIQEDRVKNPDKYKEDKYGTTTLSCTISDCLLSDKERSYLRDRVCTSLSLPADTLPLVDGGPNSLPNSTKTASCRVITTSLGFWQGKVEITFPDEKIHELIHQTIHGQGVRFGQRLLSCEVSHSFIEFPASNVSIKLSDRKPDFSQETPKLSCLARSRDGVCACSPCPICNVPGGFLYEEDDADL